MFIETVRTGVCKRKYNYYEYVFQTLFPLNSVLRRAVSAGIVIQGKKVVWNVLSSKLDLLFGTTLDNEKDDLVKV